MTPHLHGTVVPGCFRCGLGKEESRAALLDQLGDAASEYREASEWLIEAEAAARRVGLSEDQIRKAKGGVFDE